MMEDMKDKAKLMHSIHLMSSFFDIGPEKRNDMQEKPEIIELR